MNNEDVRAILDTMRIPRATVSSLCDLKAAELSAYLRDRRGVSETKAAKIESVVEELKELLGSTWPMVRLEIPVSIDLRDVPALRELLKYLREIQHNIDFQRNQGADPQEQDRS
jgi:endonuclease III